MKTLNLFLLATFSLLIFSCGSPLDKKYSKENSKEDLAALVGEIDTTDAMLIAGTLIRLTFEGKEIEGMTYRELLQSGKEFKQAEEKRQEEERLLAEKAAAEEAARIEKLNNTVTATLFEKGFVKYNYQDYITYKFAFENKSNKEIRALKGVFDFQDLFGSTIKKISIVYDDPIAIGSVNKYEATSDYNQFIDSDVALKNKELKDMKVVWIPEEILFNDGTSIK